MAKFKPGQLVRIVGCKNPKNRWLIGSETIVEAYCGDSLYACMHNGTGNFWLEQHLSPASPPHEACAPEFAESIRRITDSVSA